MEDFVQTIEGSAINELILGSAWLWPVMEILHFIGLSILLGALLIIDLRLAGFFRKIDIAATHKLLPWVFAGYQFNDRHFIRAWRSVSLHSEYWFLVENGPCWRRGTERAVVLVENQSRYAELGTPR